MLSTDEQLKIVHQRAQKLRARIAFRRRMAAAVCACLVLIVSLGALMPDVNGRMIALDGRYASLIQTTPGLGCVVIAVLAFALGVCVTLLCYRTDSARGKGRDEP
jgi:hypothetical protein